MASPSVTNPPLQTESKSAKKKKAKAEVAASAQSPSVSTEPPTAAETRTNGGEAYESPYLKELQRNIRNLNKKLSGYQKIDAILADNPGKSLVELVAAKKINSDQKASVEKRPALQAQLAQTEEQVSQYKKFGQEYEQRFVTEKALLVATHKEELDKARQEALAEQASASDQRIQDDLLVLSKFLRAAAARRQDGNDDTVESRAFEGALLLVYGGDIRAVAAIQKLISGADEKIPAVDSEIVDYTFAQVKQTSLEYIPASDEAFVEDVIASEQTVSAPTGLATPPAEAPGQLASDPTLVNAGLTELNDTPVTTNGFSVDHQESLAAPPTIPEQSTIDTGNAAAEASWGRDLQASGTTVTSVEDWITVPHNPTETDPVASAVPAAAAGSNSWAEEVSVEHAATPPATVTENTPTENDGFHEVVRDHGRGGRGGRGFRGGDGYRGDRRGRGGEYRGRGGFNRERGDRGSGEYRGGGRGRGGGGYRGRGRGGGGASTGVGVVPDGLV